MQLTTKEQELCKTLLKSAKSSVELRIPQSVMLTRKFGLSNKQASESLGISQSTLVRLKNRFKEIASGSVCDRGCWGGRRNSYLPKDEEISLVNSFEEQASQGEIVNVSDIKVAFEKACGSVVHKTTIYRLLYRYGWRKLSPRRWHPSGNTKAQEEFKKKSA